MKFFKQHIFTITLVAAIGICSSDAHAQLDGVTGQLQATVKSAVQGRVQTQVQQQVQAQVQAQLQAKLQQEVQTRMQQQAGTQVQAQLQADMARAATLVQTNLLSGRAKMSAAARSTNDLAAQAGSGIRNTAEAATTSALGLGVNANLNLRANAGNQANVSANSRANVSSNLIADLPAGLTQADLKLYDNIFGRFNPLLEQSATTAVQTTARAKDATSGALLDLRSRGNLQAGLSSQSKANGQANSTEQADAGSRSSAAARMESNTNATVDLATRVQAAINQRRAEISSMRDEAIDTADQQKMQAAERMEVVLNTFVQAQAHAKAAASAHARTETSAGASSTGLRARSKSSAGGTIRK